ncbi:MAG: flagellar basal body rod protein FlgB [bacterium]
MAINFEKALGIHEQSLMLRSRRSSVLSSNLANSDTPGYKAKDIDFKAELAKAAGVNHSLQLAKSNNNHFDLGGIRSDHETLFRTPLHASLDGNTVDADTERVKFTENSIRYQASLNFLTRKFSGMKKAIRGD